MKKLILILVICFSVLGYSQKCKYIKNEVDEFSKESIKITKYSRLGKIRTNNYIDVNYKSINNEKFIGLYLHLYPLYFTDLSSEILFLNDKDEVYKLKINKEQISNSYFDGFLKVIFHTMQLDFNLTNELKQFLNNNNIIKIRFNSQKENFDFEVKKTDLEKSNEIMKCID